MIFETLRIGDERMLCGYKHLVAEKDGVTDLDSDTTLAFEEVVIGNVRAFAIFPKQKSVKFSFDIIASVGGRMEKIGINCQRPAILVREIRYSGNVFNEVPVFFAFHSCIATNCLGSIIVKRIFLLDPRFLRKAVVDMKDVYLTQTYAKLYNSLERKLK